MSRSKTPKSSTTQAVIELPTHLMDPQIERAILTQGILGEAERVVELTAEGDYSLDIHRKIYQGIQETGGGLAQVAGWFLGNKSLGSMPVFETLFAVQDLVPQLPPDLLAVYARRLRQLTLDRQAYSVGQRIRAHTEAGLSGHPEELRDAQDELTALRVRQLDPNTSRTIGQQIEALEGGVNSLFARPRGGVETPWGWLNHMTNGGLRPRELWILAARTSVGKTTAALQLALHNARRARKTAFWSIEMGARELFQRAICSGGRVDFGALVGGRLYGEESRAAALELDAMRDLPLEIFTGDARLDDLLSEIGRGHYSLVVLDYLQLVTGARGDKRVDEVTMITRKLKLAAVQYNVPIVALSQLNRASDKENRAPNLTDLRESGSIEQDSDGVVFLHDPEKHKTNRQGPRTIEMIIGKQRNGISGIHTKLWFQGNHCRMVETTQEETC